MSEQTAPTDGTTNDDLVLAAIAAAGADLNNPEERAAFLAALATAACDNGLDASDRAVQDALIKDLVRVVATRWESPARLWAAALTTKLMLFKGANLDGQLSDEGFEYAELAAKRTIPPRWDVA